MLHTINVEILKQFLSAAHVKVPTRLPIAVQPASRCTSVCAIYGLVITDNSNVSFECPASAAGMRATVFNWA